MPECFKTYEVSYGSDTVYTQSVNGMRYWMEQSGGLLYPGRLRDFCKHLTFDHALDFYKNTYGTSIGTTTRSCLANSAKLPGEKAVVFRRPTRTDSGGSNSHYVTLHSLFSQVVDQIKDKDGKYFVFRLLYEGLGRLLEMDNKSKDNKTKGEQTPRYAPIPDSSSVVISSTGVEMGVVVITGSVDNNINTQTCCS